MEERISKIIEEVHKPIDLKKYESTSVRDNTNCYAYAIGATYPYLKLYRIGAISQLKPIDEKFTSKEERLNLLFKDLEVLKLKYEPINSENEVDLNDNQFIIKMYIQVLPNGIIFDSHFIRFENGKWTEKRKGQRVSELYDKDMYDKKYLWKHVITLKITR